MSGKLSGTTRTRKVWRHSIEGDFAAGLENIQLKATEIGHDGDLAWIVGNNTIDFPMGGTMGGTMGTGTGNYVVIYRREEDGAWRIAVDTWNDAP